MGIFLADVRLALRAWRKRPGFYSLVLLTLSLGIGANALVFSVIDGALLRPLPYRDAERLAVIRTELVAAGEPIAKSSPPELADLRKTEGIFESLGAVWARPAALTDDRSEPEEIQMGFVSAGFLSVFGVEPLLGRDLQPSEDFPNAPRVVVLSHGLWQRRYGGDPEIVGKTLEMDGEPATIVGVMPSSFALIFPPDADVPAGLELWAPFGGGYEESPRSFRVLTVIGRLSENAGFEESRARIDALSRRLVADHPGDYRGAGLKLHIEALHPAVTEHVRPALVVLWGTVVFVLFIACANVANLLLVRATALEHEYLVKRALGASRSRLIRQVVTETVLLTLAGGLAGALLAEWGVALLPWLAPADIPRIAEVAVDSRVLAVLAAASLLCGAGIGLISALHLSRPRATLTLRSRGEAPGGQRIRRVLLASEIALALVLLVGGGLLLRSFRALSQVSLGYETGNVSTFKLSLIDSEYPYSDPQKIAGFYRELAHRIAAMSGVEAAGAAIELPLDSEASRLAPYTYESDQGIVEWGTLSAEVGVVTPGFLEAIDATLLEGRLLEWTDDLAHPAVVVVDDLLARAVWPGESAVGKRLQVTRFLGGEFQRTWCEVVGVVAHVRHDPKSIGEEQIFLPHPQTPMRTMTFAVENAIPLESLAEQVRSEVRALEPSQPIHSIRPMDDYRASALSTHRFTMNTLGSFAAVALVLASLGVYGVMAFAVSQRTREIGLRMALGATPRSILAQVLREGVFLVAPGIALGIAGAFALARFLSSLLYQVTASDPATFVLVALTLLAVAIAACYVPGRRASSINPLEALREE
jgi:putative ABC transport system permease protein